MEELEHFDRRRRGADVDRLDLVEPEHLAQAGEDLRVGLGDLLGELGRDLLAALLEADLASAASSAACIVARCSSGCAAIIVSRPGLQLLPDARHGEEPARAHFGQVGEHLARIVAAGDLQAEHDRQVVVGVALGDVRRGQPRDHAPVLAGTRSAPRGLRRPRAGCGGSAARPSAARSCPRCRSASARRSAAICATDASTSKSGFEPSTSASASVPAGGSPSTTITCSSVATPSRASSTCGRYCCSQISTFASASPQQVADLLGRVGVVDRERRRAEHHRGEVAEVELGAVGEHQRDRLAALDAELRQAAGERVDALAAARPR